MVKLVFLRYGNFIRRVTLDRIIPADQCHNMEEDDIDHNDVENSDRLLDDDFNEVEIVAEKKKEIEKLQQQNKDQADRIKELEEKTSVPDKRRNNQTSSCILPKQFQKISFKVDGKDEPMCGKVMTKHKEKSIHRNILGIRLEVGVAMGGYIFKKCNISHLSGWFLKI